MNWEKASQRTVLALSCQALATTLGHSRCTPPLHWNVKPASIGIRHNFPISVGRSRSPVPRKTRRVSAWKAKSLGGKRGDAFYPSALSVMSVKSSSNARSNKRFSISETVLIVFSFFCHLAFFLFWLPPFYAEITVEISNKRYWKIIKVALRI